MLQFKIVQPGTFEMDGEKGIVENRPTCSLIESDGRNIFEKWNVLIDLDHPARKHSDLENSLAALNVSPKQINVIILTHLHPDHIGHKNLFPNALFIFHKDEPLSFYFKNDQIDELEGDAVYEVSADSFPQNVYSVTDLKNLGDSIYIHHCPGHTKGSLVMFLCVNGLVYAIAGGIFLNREYFDNWQPPGMSWKQEMIYEHMSFIKEHADVIVPGHGPPFNIN